MSASAESIAANISSRRNVTIEISNVTNDYCLADPKVYLESGNCHSPPQPTICPLKTELCNFSKSGGKAEGAVGVLTYDIIERTGRKQKERLAIMFSVPYENNMYKNWAAVGIYGDDKDCDENLYKEMYDDKETTFVRQEGKGCGFAYVGQHLDVLCTMSPMGRAIMKVEVWSKCFTHLDEHSP